MVSQQIIDYIEKTRKAGYSESQIRETLKKTGWTDADIEEAMNRKIDVPIPDVAPTPPQKESQSNTLANTGKTNTLAIIALITSFLIPLVPLFLAIISLIQIHKKKEKGQVLAIIAIVVSLTIGLFSSMMLIASLAYFGVLDPVKLLPERCTFPAGIDCIDRAVISSSEITIALINNIGFPISVQKVESTNCKGTTQIAIGDQSEFTNLNNNQVNNYEKFRLKLTGCNNGKSGQEVKDTIDVLYLDKESLLDKTATGDIRGKVV